MQNAQDGRKLFMKWDMQLEIRQSKKYNMDSPHNKIRSPP